MDAGGENIPGLLWPPTSEEEGAPSTLTFRCSQAGGQGNGDALVSVPRSPEVNIKENALHRSNGLCAPAEEGLAPSFPLEPRSSLFRQVGAPSVPTFKDHGDSFCLRMLLFGTEQINCTSLEFPLLHQSPFAIVVGEK